MTDVKHWHSEYELRQFIDKATRWKIDAVYNGRTTKNPYHIFRYFIENSDDNYDAFCLQLREVLSKHEHWKAIEIDLKNRFLPMINQYIEWYKTHETELQKFEPYNPYSLMLDVIEQTKKEILKYFPESLPQPEKREDGISVPVLALYYYYLQLSKKIPHFEQSNSTKDEAIQKLLEDNNHTFSWKYFRNVFYAIGKGTEKDPLKKRNLEKVIKLLKYEPAKTLAENDLYSIE